MPEVGSLFVRLKLDASEFNQQLRDVGSQVHDVGQSLQSTGKDLSKNVTAPILAVGTAAGVMGASFETEMQKIVGLVGVSQDQVDEWSGQLLRLGPEVGKSPQELAKALFFVTSAGFRGEEALDVLTSSAMASAAGLGDTVTIADLVTSAINAYGAENLDAAGATDTLVAAVREGKAAPEELAGAMGQALPIASAMGVGFDEVSAAVAAMTRTGTPAATAAIQLRQIMAQLLKPTEGASDVLNLFGTSADELRGRIGEEGLFPVLMDLREMFGDYDSAVLAIADAMEVSTEEAEGFIEAQGGLDNMITTVFGNVRALSGVLDLTGANAGENAAIFDALADSTGALDHAFESVQDTAGFKFNQTMAELKGTLIELSADILPIVSQGLTMLGGLIRRFSDWWGSLGESTRRTIVIFAGVAAAIGPILIIVGKLVTVFALFLNPVGLVVLAIAALTAGFILAYKESETFRNIVDGAIKVVRDIATAAFPVILDAVRTAFEGAKSVTEAVWPVVREVVERALDSIRWVVDNVIPPVWEVIQLVWGEIAAFTQEIWPQVQEIIAGVVELIVTVVERNFELVRAVVERVWPHVQTIISTVMTVIEEVVGRVLGFVTGVWERSGEQIVSHVRQSWETIKDLIRAALDIIQGIIETVLGLITGDWERAWDGVKQIAEGIWTAITSIIDLAISGIRTIIEIGLAAVVTLFGDTWEQVKDVTSSGVEAVVSFISELPGRIQAFFADAATWLIEAGKDIIKGLINGIKDALPGLDDVFGGITDRIPKLKGPRERDRKLLFPAGEWIMEGLERGIESRIGNLERTLGSISNVISGFSPEAGAGADNFYKVVLSIDGREIAAEIDAIHAELLPFDIGAPS